MTESTMPSDRNLVADLNDLLQLDHDAVEGYTIAINTIRNEMHREVLVAFRADHKRHIEDLAALIRERGALPLELPHLPTGPIKLAVQALGGMGNDATVLLAFKAVEGQVRDKYRRFANKVYPTDVAAVVGRNADDEDRHYRWVAATLREMGYGEDSVQGRVERVAEAAHKAIADPIEKAGRAVMKKAEEIRPHRS